MRDQVRSLSTALGAALLAAACTSDASAPPTGTGGLGAATVASQSPGQAAGKPGSRAEPGDWERVTWSDGERQRSAWIDPSHVCDHAPDDASRALVRALAPAATELESGTAGVRLWSLGEGEPTALDACDALRSGAGRFSPVFRDAPVATSPMRSAPGGVVVACPQQWSVERARARLAELGLAVERELPLGAPTLVVASGPGLDALELCRRLDERGEFRWATPDWWVPVAAR